MSKKRSEFQSIVKTLKGLLKAKGIKYKDLAEQLGISEATIKRMFSGYETNIGKILDICETVGVSFFDVCALAKDSFFETTILTKKQDSYFAKHIKTYAVFAALYHAESVEEFLEKSGMTKHELDIELAALENLGLVSIGSSGVDWEFKGKLQWKNRRDLHRTLGPRLIMDFLRDVVFGPNSPKCYDHSAVKLSPKSQQELQTELNEITNRYIRKSSYEEKVLPPHKLFWTRWVIAAEQHQINWYRYIRNSEIES